MGHSWDARFDPHPPAHLLPLLKAMLSDSAMELRGQGVGMHDSLEGTDTGSFHYAT